MVKVFKIHPAIGVMRAGDSPDGFFIGPESLGHPGIEQVGGAENRVEKYKAAGRIKRQAARFRIWEYDRAADGTLTPVREVTAADAVIEWRVELVNRKAAGMRIVAIDDPGGLPRRVLVPGNTPRNPGLAEADLVIRDPRERKVSGKNQPAVPFDQGKFLGKTVYLGELRTDAAGRLLVLGGRGDAEGIPVAAGQPVPPLSDFANNRRWHDDVSDGPVTARVTLAGQPAQDAVGAWVIGAPPDFAPEVGGVVTLYEVALQAAIDKGLRTPPATPSFRRDIWPTVVRASRQRWIHTWEHWDVLPRDGAALSDPSPAQKAKRELVFAQITQNSFNDFGLPPFLRQILQKWVDGNFVNDWQQVLPPLPEPEALDRAALEACIGTSFFPGIEAGFLFTRPDIYAEPFRLSHQQLRPGGITEVMALPWQADFNDCADDWWPAQRPNSIFTKAAQVPDVPVEWADGVYSGGNSSSRLRMVKNFSRLGFVVPKPQGNDVFFLEDERDSSLPARP